jgi:hypothetical protein
MGVPPCSSEAESLGEQFAAHDPALVDEPDAVMVDSGSEAVAEDAAGGVDAEQSGHLDAVPGLLLHLPPDGVVGVLAVLHAAARHDPLGRAVWAVERASRICPSRTHMT